MKQLSNTLFDAITANNDERVYHVGKFSKVYEWIGKFIPERMVSQLFQRRMSSVPDGDWNIV